MPHAASTVAHDHERAPEPSGRGVTITIKQIIVGLVVGGILAGVGYVSGLGTHDAAQQVQLQAVQKEVDSKVDRAEFIAFVRSVESLTTETKLLRDELQKTREELAAERGRRGRIAN